MASTATKGAMRRKAVLTLTVCVEFIHDHDARWVRDTLPPPVFDALAVSLSQSIAPYFDLSDVQRITVFEENRNVGTVISRRI